MEFYNILNTTIPYSYKISACSYLKNTYHFKNIVVYESVHHTLVRQSDIKGHLSQLNASAPLL